MLNTHPDHDIDTDTTNYKITTDHGRSESDAPVGATDLAASLTEAGIQVVQPSDELFRERQDSY